MMKDPGEWMRETQAEERFGRVSFDTAPILYQEIASEFLGKKWIERYSPIQRSHHHS